MIISTYTYITLNSSNKKQLINLGLVKNNTISSGQNKEHIVIKIKIDDCLLITKNFKLDVSCDLCGKINNIIYKSYIKNLKKNKKYICKSCGAIIRSSDIKYREKMRQIACRGENHRYYKIKKELHPSYGRKHKKSTILKIKKTKKRILDNGLTVAQNAALKSAKTMRDNGIYEKNAIKIAKTKDKNNTWVTYKCKKYKGLYYRSSLELDFIKRAIKTGIRLRNCSEKYQYIINGKSHYYFPDFYDIDKKEYFEIKSDYTWYANKEVNIEKYLSIVNLGLVISLVIYNSTLKNNYDEPIFYKNYNRKQLESI